MKTVLFILGCIGVISFLAIRYVSTPRTTTSTSSQSNSKEGGGFTSSSGGSSVRSALISPSPSDKVQQFMNAQSQIPSPQVSFPPAISSSLPNIQTTVPSFPHVSPSQIPPSPPPLAQPYKTLPSPTPNLARSKAAPASLDSPTLQRQIPALQFPQSPINFLSELFNLWLFQFFDREGLLSAR